MTSNQISYWANQEKVRATDETIRSNKAREEETHRHNVEDEDIRHFEAYLKERGVNQKDRELMLKDLENQGKYGYEYGENNQNLSNDLMKIYHEAWNMVFGNKGIGSLGSFF